ncbi:MAG TPA: glutamine-hydrolyzing GMP synthase, partial [Dongiaceae bacterium]|nr:glutamine-hydrolyzing GMP synthase [Dongiaceae bacterium]
MTDRILILDFGSQVTQLIARRLRETGVYCEIFPFNCDPQRITEFAPKGIILSGSPHSIHAEGGPQAPDVVWSSKLPVLGICYGQQAICHQLGGKVEPHEHREFGRAEIEITESCSLFDGFWPKGAKDEVWMSHGDRVTAIPPGFRVVAVSKGAPFAAIADETRHYYGVQFHPEVVHTPRGAKLLQQFVHQVCGCKGDWTMRAFRESEVAKIR